MTWNRVGTMVVLLGCGAGCKETTDCDNIRTPGIAMLTEIIAGANARSVVTTELRVGGAQSNTYCVLGSGDELVAVADGEERSMQAIDDGVYEVSFSTIDEDTAFEVRLERDVDDDSTGNMGTLPAPFEISSSFPSAVSRADDDLTVEWDPSGTDDDMELGIEDDAGGCLRFDENVDIGGDPGTQVVAAGTLESSDDEQPETCDLTLTLTRTRRGSVDGGLDRESRFLLRQVRTDTFASAP